jgi:ferredoxin
MSFVIAQPCIGVKDTACVDVCPVDSIGPRKDQPAFAQVDQLYIDPGVCIDCGLCVLACPVRAIFHERTIPARFKSSVTRNAEYFARAVAPALPGGSPAAPAKRPQARRRRPK